jgi:hypothetical protein
MRLGISASAVFGATLLLGAACAFLPAAGARAQASSCIDVALVFAVDSSASVSREEFALQQQGIATALRDPRVLTAIEDAGKVAVSILYWGSEGLPKPQSGWVLLNGREDAERFARTVESMPRLVTGDTGLGAGLMSAIEKLDALGTCTARRVVNVSGDGEETRLYRQQRKSLPPPLVRELANKQQVEINALAIANEESDLALYYTENVITGPDAFVMEIRDYGEFAEAMTRKLIREIGPRAVSETETRKTGTIVETRLMSRDDRPARFN